jgi:hypothetical protein
MQRPLYELIAGNDRHLLVSEQTYLDMLTLISSQRSGPYSIDCADMTPVLPNLHSHKLILARTGI